MLIPRFPYTGNREISSRRIIPFSAGPLLWHQYMTLDGENPLALFSSSLILIVSDFHGLVGRLSRTNGTPKYPDFSRNSTSLDPFSQGPTDLDAAASRHIHTLICFRYGMGDTGILGSQQAPFFTGKLLIV